MSTQTQSVISDEQKQFFLDNGYLILRSVLKGEELRRIQQAMQELVDYATQTVRDHPDYMYGTGPQSGQPVLRRIEYVIDKRDEMKVLLGHPFILRSVEKLIGKDFIPTWDSMVLKMPGEGIIVPWHRDAGTECVGDTPIFNVDFYLDEADEDTCLWVIPGSHKWDAEQAQQWIAQRRDNDLTKEHFRATGAVPVLMQPGDVLFHNILLVHGSPYNLSDKMRRVVYYEFRAAHVEYELGPHVPEYIPLKQRVLLSCLEKRQQADYIGDEGPFVYDPPAPFKVEWTPGTVLPTYRYAHQDYWRK